MNAVHTYGIEGIQFLQKEFQNYGDFMMTASHLGDPKNAFLILFPLAYCLHKPTGIHVLWLAGVAEWINALLKWVFHGHRPYWWVPESNQYNINSTVIEQYKLTCESGPGSPSGHAMVTASVVFYMVTTFIQNYKDRSFVQRAAWLFLVVFLMAVNVSRLFIATHFPHQVILGTIIGIGVTFSARHVAFNKADLRTHILASLAIPLTCIATFYIIKWVGLDPQWSIAMATKHCARREWVHLDTTLFNAVYRDAGSIMGLGLHQWFVSSVLEDNGGKRGSRLLTVRPAPPAYFNRAIHVILALFLCQLGGQIVPGQHSAEFYYFFTYVKYAVLVMVVMTVPRVFNEANTVTETIVIRSSAESKED